MLIGKKTCAVNEKCFFASDSRECEESSVQYSIKGIDLFRRAGGKNVNDFLHYSWKFAMDRLYLLFYFVFE